MLDTKPPKRLILLAATVAFTIGDVVALAIAGSFFRWDLPEIFAAGYGALVAFSCVAIGVLIRRIFNHYYF